MLMYELLLQKFQQGHFGEILSLTQSTDLSTGTDPRSMHVVAASHFSLGQISEALEILVELESSLGEDDGYLGLYGAVLRRSGNFIKAQEVFLRAISASPESFVLKNNYANLLIDMGDYEGAESLLKLVLDKAPDYTDASENLSRLRTLRDYQIAEQSRQSTSKQLNSSVVYSASSLLDPLLMAFDQVEVREHGRLKSISGLKDVCSTVPKQQMATDKLKLAQKSVSEGNPTFALDLCSQAYTNLGFNPELFGCVSDAYISANRFLEAEISLLHSLLNAGPTIKHFINLVSFASMRKDFQLAEFYFKKASCVDPTNPSLVQVRQLLDSRKASANQTEYDFATIPSNNSLEKV